MTDPVLISLGSINADFQVRTPRPLQAGETIIADHFTRLGGGKAANRAFLARKLGHAARLLGRVGQDDLRDQALGPLRRAGIDLAGVTEAEGVATAVSMIAVPADGKKSIVLAANANDAWDEPAIASAVRVIEAAPAGSVLSADCEVAPDAVRRCVAAAQGRGLLVVLDPAPAARADRALLRACFAVAPDAREAAELTGSDTGSPEGAAGAARALAAFGPALACVKLGDGGCVAAHGGEVWHVPPVPVDVVDSTGAGDAFTGGLAVALLEGLAARDAVLFAVAASHLAVTGWGSQESYPSREQIRAMAVRLGETAHGIA